MILNDDVLRRTFKFVIAPGDLASVSTLVSLDNTCTQFRQILDSRTWFIESLKITKDDRQKFPISLLADQRLKVYYQLYLLNKHNFIDWFKTDFDIMDISETEQTLFLSVLHEKLRGKLLLSKWFYKA